MKKIQLKNKFKFSYFKYPENNLLLNEELLDSMVELFFEKIVMKHGQDVVMIQLIILTDKKYRSLSNLEVVDHTLKEQIKVLFKEKLNFLYESYYDLNLDSLFIRYKILEKSSPVAKISLEKKGLSKNTTELLTLKHYNLPKTMNLQIWKDYLIQELNFKLILETNLYLVFYNETKKSTLIIDIIKQNFEHKITLNLDNKFNIFSFIDTGYPENFTRTLENGNILKYKGGEQVMFYPKQRPVAFMLPKNKDTKILTNFITLDLETRTLQNGNLEVISASFFDGLTYFTYFISDYTNSQSMLKSMIKDLFLISKKQEITKVYIHNFSNFDSVFLLNLLAVMSSTFNIIKRDDNIISLHVSKKWSKNSISKLVFLDSFLLLPEKLSKLAETFGGELKGKMDFEVINQSQNLNLLRDEIIAYNKQDCLVLHQVITKFACFVYKHFTLDLHKYPTLSSLALAIFKSNFLSKDANIPITDTFLYDKIKSGYTGGQVDIYKPSTEPNSNLYCYDVNSLYPYVMAMNQFPVGNPRYFEGSQIDLQALDTFGFLRVKVTAPKDLNIPLLQVRRNGKTITPLGTWTDWYFSEELKLALTLGYKFEVMEGILFERGEIFSGFVTNLYNLRKSFSKNDPKNVLCKLILNGLYGRFGMSPQLQQYKLVDYTQIEKNSSRHPSFK